MPPTRWASGTSPPRTRRTWPPRASTWPLGRGFDRWYGFHGGETHQFVPALYHDNHSVRPPTTIEDGYHLSEDLADRAIEFVSDLRAVDADQPFFLYIATGACHSPHHAPAEWIERYAGAFDDGWDALARADLARQLDLGVVPRRDRAQPSTILGTGRGTRSTTDERAVAARFMECFAGFLSYTDHQLGRVVDFVDELGELDNTLILVVSDNGASAEGGPEGSINDIRLSEPRSGRDWRDVRPPGRDRWPADATTTIPGAGRWPATRRSSAGSARSTREGWPIPAL